MGLYFRNNTPNTLYIAFAYYDSACEGAAGVLSFRKKGWHVLAPGQTKLVWSGWAGGRRFYFYAEDSVGNKWDGPHTTYIPRQAFNLCWGVGCSTCRILGLRETLIGDIFSSDIIIPLRLRSSTAWLNPKIFHTSSRRKSANRLKRSLSATPATHRRLKRAKTKMS